jgi:ribosomal protein S18 acetylase RimI-like enzyme
VSLRLRDAVPADIPAMLGFARALTQHEGRPEAVTATEAGLRAMLFGEPRRAWAMMAEWDGGAVGYAIWSYRFVMYHAAVTLYVSNVFVAPAARGSGIGRAIFAALARRARAEGCVSVEWGVREDNLSAFAFYDALGAERSAGSVRMALKGEALDRLAA